MFDWFNFVIIYCNGYVIFVIMVIVNFFVGLFCLIIKDIIIFSFMLMIEYFVCYLVIKIEYI